MKTKWFFVAVAVLLISAGVFWLARGRSSAVGLTASDGRKPLYYTCAMHPWVHESKPGSCPVCGMNLTPVYDNHATTSTNATVDAGTVTLEPDSISVIHVQTDTVERQPVRRSIHLAGQITENTATDAWFEATIYQRDLEWLKNGQPLEIVVAGAPDKIFTAEIKAQGLRPAASRHFDMMTGSTTLRVEISNPPVEVGDWGKYEYFDGLHADAHIVAETEPTLAIPRSAIISRGLGAMVYVDGGNGRYIPRRVQLGRMGDDLVEILSGLKTGEKVITTGNILIDSEAQLTAGQ